MNKEVQNIPVFPILRLQVVDGIPETMTNIKFESSANFTPESTFYTICVTEANTERNASLGVNLSVQEAQKYCESLGKKILNYRSIENLKTFSLFVQLQVR
jgi:hypothetical protein